MVLQNHYAEISTISYWIFCFHMDRSKKRVIPVIRNRIFWDYQQKKWRRTRKVRTVHCLQCPVERTLTFYPLLWQLLLKHCIDIKLHCIFSQKYPFDTKFFTILMIYALLSLNFVAAIYALFPQKR